MLRGSCLCGDIRFEVRGSPRGVSACHCSQCRKQSGGVWHSAHVPDGDLTIIGVPLWFEASATARRGSCPRCGAFLFWKAQAENSTSFALGAVDGPTGLSLSKHIFVAGKGDYYHIADGVPQRD